MLLIANWLVVVVPLAVIFVAPVIAPLTSAVPLNDCPQMVREVLSWVADAAIYPLFTSRTPFASMSSVVPTLMPPKTDEDAVGRV